MKNFFVFTTLLASCSIMFAQTFSVKKIEGKRIEVTKSLDDEPATKIAVDFVAPYKVKVDSVIGPVLGQSSIYMNADRPESLLGNWTADVLLEASKRVDGKKQKRADFAVVNVGGLRNSMPKGNVTIGDVMEISPFNNCLSVLTLSGDKVLELFQQFSIFGGEAVSHGLQIVYRADGKLQSAKLNGKDIDPKRIYRVATLDYLAEGNDNMKALKDCLSCQKSNMLVRDIYMDFIREQTKKGKQLTACLEGRTVILPSEETAKKPEVKRLFITHTNDTHSCIYPINQNFSDTAQANKAGYIRRFALVGDLRRQHPDDMLLFDSGDFSQGSPYYNLFHGDVEVGLMNLMGYDAATIGNHEFDFGLENMARIFRMAKFPIVCCNYDFTGTPVEGIVTPYYIIERGGLKIGVLGVCPPLAGLVATECYGATKYLDPIAEANRIAAMLKNDKQCDLVVCLSHLGWNAEAINDQLFIAGTRNIDIVLGGHTHTYFTEPRYVNNLDGQPVLCNQMGKNARYVGTLDVELTK
ncbi:MAG: 5'-nucleotidase C-terminal domain-containing protein [Bacteroidaceae bacterium]|nr:5'-nucleotidase C-terminal domain-containing protein [Bacteroidaceae bacterium]